MATLVPPLVVGQVTVLLSLMVSAVLVGPLCVEKFQLVGLTPAFSHLLCAHMVPLVLGCGGHGSVLLPLRLNFQLGSKRHLTIVREKLNCVWMYYSSCILNVYVVAAVMILCPIYVPSILTPWCPTFSDCWFEMNDCLCSRWCKRSCIEIKQAMELCMC